ncbi:MAG: leuD [Rhodospirillales bacterium]|nr:leuD [Rhodospirillales bacterium]
MQSFAIVTGIAASLPASNVDTDVIMPKQFLKGVDRSGLRDGVFHDLRFGTSKADFVLNRNPWREARFLVVGPNFGCGSSREHAVWGLGQFGIRALIGTSFAGIFFDNCAHNGLLAITLEPDQIETLTAVVSNPASAELTIDLPNQTITAPSGLRIAFDIESGRKESLVLGLDAVGTTLQAREAIKQFERGYLRENPWLA